MTLNVRAGKGAASVTAVPQVQGRHTVGLGKFGE